MRPLYFGWLCCRKPTFYLKVQRSIDKSYGVYFNSSDVQYTAMYGWLGKFKFCFFGRLYFATNIVFLSTIKMIVSFYFGKTIWLSVTQRVPWKLENGNITQTSAGTRLQSKWSSENWIISKQLRTISMFRI